MALNDSLIEKLRMLSEKEVDMECDSFSVGATAAAHAELGEQIISELKKWMEENRKAVPERYGWDFEILCTSFFPIIRRIAGEK